VFFEISDDFLMINNYVRSFGSGNAVKLAGSSGLKLINNTIIGGNDALGVYVDVRSKPGCADPAQALCASSYSSDRDTVRTLPSTLDWIPRIDLMINNIIAYPTGSGFCGRLSAMCITKTNGAATVALNTVLHQADAARGIPKTDLDNNVYANGSGSIIAADAGTMTGYTTLASFTAAMAGSPVSISGLEANSKYANSWVNSDGTPTSSLTAVHSQAEPVPTNAAINAYLSAGLRHYGATYK
jgi:pectin methylesterase-like acyl-CoA thioesterase